MLLFALQLVYEVDGVVDLLEQKSDIKLVEIQAELARAGVTTGIGTIWRFFDRPTFPKSRRGRPLPPHTGRMLSAGFTPASKIPARDL